MPAPLSIETDYLGRENCPEILNVTRPDVIQDIHRAVSGSRRRHHRDQHLRRHADRAGRQQAGRPRLRAELRRRQDSRAKWPTSSPPPRRPRFVAGSIGPTNKDLNITGTTTFAELRADYYEQAKGLVEGGADYPADRNLLRYRQPQGRPGGGANNCGAIWASRSPWSPSVTIERTGTMLGGQPIDALYASIENHDLLAVGMNCATGPDLMTDHIRTLQRDVVASASRAIRMRGCRTPKASSARRRNRWRRSWRSSSDHGWLNFVGGCCGTTPAHIRAIAQMVQGKRPRQRPGASIAPTIRASNWWRPRRATGR